MIKKLLICLLDLMLAPFVLPSGLVLKKIRSWGVEKFPLCKTTLMKIGVFPIIDHYYEPKFNFKGENNISNKPRMLTGIEWNIDGQLQLLNRLGMNNEFTDNVLNKKTYYKSFNFDNNAFESGDAEYWYKLIRHIKPSRIIEIGSGYSTIVASCAIDQNIKDNHNYQCEHVCIEPFEMPWLENTNVSVIRESVESIDLNVFSALKKNDILFIDSSHMIRPEGDVLFEYLQILPSLNNGVIVHIHDIFSPMDYPKNWLSNEVKFWNEQYLVEAFLTNNNNWEIIGALNLLNSNHHDTLKLVTPYVTKDRQPGSFYIRKLG